MDVSGRGTAPLLQLSQVITITPELSIRVVPTAGLRGLSQFRAEVLDCRALQFCEDFDILAELTLAEHQKLQHCESVAHFP